MAEFLLFILACLSYSQTLRFGFIQDDHLLILNNPLMRSWASLPALLTTGYWQAAIGKAITIHEYRPLTVLTFFLQAQAPTQAPWPFHLVNVLLHGACTVALFALLIKMMPRRAALWGAALFAVHPSHVEAVAHITGRSELLGALSVLACLRFLLEDRPVSALAAFFFGLMSKESVAMLPAAWLALDWLRRGRDIREGSRVHLTLWAALAFYILLRAAVLPHAIQGGTPYFAGTSIWVKWLTLAAFWTRYYAAPMVIGARWGLDFKRPFFPDAMPLSAGPVLLLALWIALATAAIRSFRRRRQSGFWILFGFLFILPTSHLLFNLDTLGAERFLYLPSTAYCALLGSAIERLALPPASRRVALAIAAIWYATMTFEHAKIWRDAETYYSAVLAQNPASSSARSEIGLVHLQKGDAAAAESDFRRAIALDAANPTPYYNLAKLLLDQNRATQAEEFCADALRLDPGNPDTLDLMGLLKEKKGRPDEAIDCYFRAAALNPWDSTALFNLGRLYFKKGMPAPAGNYWERFLRLAPNDPQAEEVRMLLRRTPH